MKDFSEKAKQDYWNECITIKDLKKKIIQNIPTADKDELNNCLYSLLKHDCQHCPFYYNCMSNGLDILLADEYHIVDKDGDEIFLG